MDSSIFEIDSSQNCDAWFLNDCPQTQRILFILQFYQKWIGHHLKPKPDQVQFQIHPISDFIFDQKHVRMCYHKFFRSAIM